MPHHVSKNMSFHGNPLYIYSRFYHFNADMKHESTFSIRKVVHKTDFIDSIYCKNVHFDYTTHKVNVMAPVNIMAFVY